jgi:uncharacterized protein
MGSIRRTAHQGLQTTIVDNVEDGRFEVCIDGQVVGWQPYRRYREHIVLMQTRVDEQWRERGIASALIGGVLDLIRAAGASAIPRCKLTGDYIVHHPEYRDLVPDQYQALLQPMSRPAG